MFARYSRNLKFQKTHFFIGLAIALVFTAVVTFQGFNFWIWQAKMVSGLLSFAGVPHNLFIWTPITRGPTFEMLVTPQSVPLIAVIGSLLFFFSFVLILKRSSRIPSPVKAIALVVSLTTIFTLLWQTVISPVPLYTLHWVTIDWSCSGVIGLCLITLIYTPFLFALRGPLRVKVFWLLITIGFSVIWNLLRMSLVTATLYYFGLSVFLLFHYFAGAFIDFIYIITFYSLALYHLSKFEAYEVMKIDG